MISHELSNRDMKTVEEIRVARLRMLIQEHGSAAALNRVAGRNERDSTFSQILTGAPNSKTGKPKTMGSDLARDLEAATGKPRGWMDNDPDGPHAATSSALQVQEPVGKYAVSKDSWPFTSIAQQDVEKLPLEAKNRLEGAIGLAIAQLGLNLQVAPVAFAEAPAARSSTSRLDNARAVLASVQAGGEEAANDPGFVEIRRAAVRVSAGVRGFTADIVGSEFNGSIYLPRAVIEKHHYSVNALVATTVTGDSMAPRIGEHDVLLLNTADTDKKAGHVYGVNHDGQFLVKRLACRHKRWYLDSDNAAHPPVLAEENTFIVGRVVMMVSNEI